LIPGKSRKTQRSPQTIAKSGGFLVRQVCPERRFKAPYIVLSILLQSCQACQGDTNHSMEEMVHSQKTGPGLLERRGLADNYNRLRQGCESYPQAGNFHILAYSNFNNLTSL
jgi:hypothetical protein